LANWFKKSIFTFLNLSIKRGWLKI
jgi:hypothetical protein